MTGTRLTGTRLTGTRLSGLSGTGLTGIVPTRRTRPSHRIGPRGGAGQPVAGRPSRLLPRPVVEVGTLVHPPVGERLLHRPPSEVVPGPRRSEQAGPPEVAPAGPVRPLVGVGRRRHDTAREQERRGRRTDHHEWFPHNPSIPSLLVAPSRSGPPTSGVNVTVPPRSLRGGRRRPARTRRRR
ncbi:hypothetical protein [Paractinoplanes brasiliensis]|uniref:hypothetical protein n=1 Tax=Paractinoplanes brasiliensis TaxID=52695 RepID=UPI0034DB0B09